jgi:hypothetical protein
MPLGITQGLAFPFVNQSTDITKEHVAAMVITRPYSSEIMKLKSADATGLYSDFDDAYKINAIKFR